MQLAVQMIRIAELYRDYGISMAPTGHKHARSGWVQTPCPFCEGNEGFHLGYNLSKGYFNCWRCGWKPDLLALALVLKIPESKVTGIFRSYRAQNIGTYAADSQKFINQIPSPKDTPYPPNSRPLLQQHKNYLLSRKFVPDRLEKQWKLLATGPVSWSGWAWRIVVPIFFNGRLVSHQSRSISDHPDVKKYMACPEQLEIIKHKHILFGLDQAQGQVAVVVEGVFDVFRLGPGAIATFGTSVKPSQRMLLRRFKRLFILFDTDAHGAGQEAGEKLAWQMTAFGLDVHQVKLDWEDPGKMDQKEAQNLMRDLGIF